MSILGLEAGALAITQGEDYTVKPQPLSLSR